MYFQFNRNIYINLQEIFQNNILLSICHLVHVKWLVINKFIIFNTKLHVTFFITFYLISSDMGIQSILIIGEHINKGSSSWSKITCIYPKRKSPEVSTPTMRANPSLY